MTVEKSSLTIIKTLGEGGFGKVFLVQSGASAAPWAYKEFKKPNATEIANLRLLVGFRDNLSVADRANLDGFALWPRELVTSGAAVVGYLMEVLPDRFIEQAIVQTSGTTQTPRTLDWLAKPDHSARRGASLVVAETDISKRATFAALIAFAFNFLHNRGIVFGDVSAMNVLHADGPPEIRLIDLDTVRLIGRSPEFKQPHTTGMMPAECRAGQKEQTIETDLFKLGYLFFTVLASVAQISSSVQTVGKVDAKGMDLFGKALGSVPADRPSALEWYRYLFDRVLSLTNPPTLKSFQAAPLYGMRGDPIDLEWEAAGYRSLVLELPTGERRDLSISATGNLELTLDRAGKYKLIAENEHGTVVAETAVVRIFDTPAIKFVDVPSFTGLEHCSLGVSDADMDVMVRAGAGFEWVEAMVARTLPTPPLPFPSVQDLVTPPFTRNVLDWSGLNDIVDEAFAPPRRIGSVEKRWHAAKARLRNR